MSRARPDRFRARGVGGLTARGDVCRVREKVVT